MSERFKVGQRPRLRVSGLAVGRDTARLVTMNSKTAYFRHPYIVGEMACEVELVEIIRHPDGTPYLETEPWPPLTPYDTGARAQPRAWSTPNRERPEAGTDDYGKVDFDDDASQTIVTVWVTRGPDGGFVVNVQPFGGDKIAVVTHDE